MLKTQEENHNTPLKVVRSVDFEIDGKGSHENWNTTSWTELQLLDKVDKAYTTKIKLLYSEKGIYVLAYCEDSLISTDFGTDQGDIWDGDVFEVFFQTDPENPLYFEYEINPLNTELTLLVPNNEGDFFGWSPWHYEDERKIKKSVYVAGGKQVSGATIESWTAEMFFPFALLKGLKNVPPQTGTMWKGNFYRMDYDTGERIKWAWKPIDVNFHQYEKYGTLIFE